MPEFLQAALRTGSFVPHGYCYLWNTPLLWLHALSDGVIALAYYCIPIFLIALALKRQDLPFRTLFWLFGGFIVSCGATHWMEVATLWYPAYWLSGTIKAITALLSVWTALELIPLFPKAVALPNIQQYELANQALQQEIAERKRVETALRESQELNARLSAAMLKEKEDVLTLFAQYAPAGIAMFDEEMCYVIASQRWVDDYHLGTIETLIGRSHYEMFPQIPERWRQIHQRCLAGANESCDEDLFIRADGVQKLVRWEIRPWYLSSGKVGGIIIFAEDITEHKQIEAALKESEMRFQALVEAIFEGFIVHEKGKVLDANPGFARMFGYSLEEVIGKSAIDFLPSESLETALRHIEDQDELPYEITGIKKDGTLINLEVVGRQCVYQGRSVRVSATRDITDRKQAEMALQQLNAELEQRVADRTAELKSLSDRLMEAQEIAHIGSWEYDINTGNIFWSNEIFRIFGLKPRQPEPDYETHLQQNFPPEDREQLRQAVIRALEHGEPYELDLQIIKADGSIGWILGKGKPILNEYHRVVRLVGVALDITARKVIEAQQERLNQLKDDFLSTVSHELRSPLASIRMAIEMLEMAFEQVVPLPGASAFAQPSRLQKYLGILRKQCDQELELVNNLLDLQRLEAERLQVNFAPIQVIEWASNITSAFESRMQERQQHLQVLLPNNPLPFSSDINVLTSVLRELLTNACKYTPPGESITVSVCLTQEYLQLRVSNSGVQIAQEDLERIFDKFYRISGGDQWKQGGTGLGLALAKKQVECLGGTMWVESNELGVHFVVKLSINEAEDNNSVI